MKNSLIPVLMIALFAATNCVSIERRWQKVTKQKPDILRFKQTERDDANYFRIATQVDESLDQIEWTTIEQSQDIERARDFAEKGLTEKYRAEARDYVQYVADAQELGVPYAKTLDQLNLFLSTKRSERIRKEIEPHRLSLIRRQPWDTLNKTSCRNIYEFLQKLPPLPSPKEKDFLKEEAKHEFWACIDRKLTSFVSRRFPAQSSVLKRPILFSDGTEAGVAPIDLFRGLLGRNPDSGARWDDNAFRLSGAGGNEFEYTVTLPEGRTMILSFRLYGDKLNCVGLRSGFEINPRNWEMAAFALFRNVSQYPEPSYWDFDWIDKQ